MTKLIIIADDLTGAIETGVQLGKQGISTKVILRSTVDLQAIFSEKEGSVLIINTESRHIHPKEAAKRVKHVVEKAKLAGVKRFYKKTDSTMRGNIGAELEAFLLESGQQSLAFIPAHPTLKRFTRKGFHYIDNQLLHETDFGRDPLEPIKQSNISEILQLQTGTNIHSIDVTKGEHLPRKDGILVFDCQSEADLKALADFLLKNSLHHSIAGSAAMVELLPKLYQLKPANLKKPKPKRPILIVNGSLNNISLDQVKHAHDKGVKMISIPLELLTDNSFYKSQSFQSLLSQIKTAITTRQNIILSSTGISDQEVVSSSGIGELNTDHYELIAKQIGLIVSAVFDEVHVPGLAVFGGDTLSGIMQAMSVKYIAPTLEVLPGVALSLVSIKNKDIQLISKPGGYGDKEVILHILDYLNGSNLNLMKDYK